MGAATKMQKSMLCCALPRADTQHYTALCLSQRSYHLPGWKTKVSTRDARTRQQREADRKVRQLEKLPRVEALHDFQYPYEKTILSDYMFQYPVYENELDTPHLFNLTPPPNFFLYWNVSDFERTSYPAVPDKDHRLLHPSTDSEDWSKHCVSALRYLKKHAISPQYIPHVRFDVNLSVVFPGTYATRARTPPSSSTPVDEVKNLNRRNFWFTAHCGNYIELTDVQHPPTVFLRDIESSEGPSFYTLIMVSPDYPYRIPAEEDVSASRGFFLHYMVANLQPETSQGAGELPQRYMGKTIVPYVAPLPTEDAGTTRHLCVLYRQAKKLELSVTPDEAWEKAHFPLALRSNFRLHDAAAGRGDVVALRDLVQVENGIASQPNSVTFFQTKWDIQVQEYYEKIGHPEPAAPVDEWVEALLEFHAAPSSEFRVRARHRPDGSTIIGDNPQFWGQRESTQIMEGSMQRLWSRRTRMGVNGVPVTYPK